MLFTSVVVVAALAAVWLVCFCVFRAVSFFLKPLLLIAFGFVSGAIGAQIDPATPPSTPTAGFLGAAMNTWRAVDNWGQVIAATALGERSPIRTMVIQLPNYLPESKERESSPGESRELMNLGQLLESIFPTSASSRPSPSSEQIAQKG